MAACGLRFAENGGSHGRRHPRIFCNLSDSATKNLDAIEVALHYPRRATIHFEGQPCRGIFAVCGGRVKLSATSSDGELMILRFAGPGEVLGLPETIAGKPYETHASASESCLLIFIERTDFMNLLKEHSDAAAQVIRELSDGYLWLIGNMRENGLARSASKKLAGFLLRWCEANGNGESSARLTVTHDEISQTIGSSRETVTRLLSVFKKKQLIRLHGSSLLITDIAALQILAARLPQELRRTPAGQL
jgi:CRP/FNR family cyclic AMP-dependent transcriptional regulator